MVEVNRVKDVAEDLRLIRSDVNTLLECLGGPATFVEGIETRLDRVRAHLEALAQIIMADPAAAVELEAVSQRAEHRQRRTV